LEFTSLSWEINLEPPGYGWIGKHFCVTAITRGRKISRYYSFMLVNLAIWADEVRNAGLQAKNYDVNRDAGRLRLHKKYYEGGLMSTYLASLPLGTSVTMKGPLGPGLVLDSFLNKDYLIFAAGTGLIPFLDIIYAVWRGQIHHGTLHVYVSFRDEASSFAVDLIEAVAKKHPKLIKVYSRIGQAGFQLHGEFWRNIMPLQVAEKAWICGPPAFNRKIQAILLENEFDKNRIIMI
jgi:nitrate reductase (NAD(P)H)